MPFTLVRLLLVAVCLGPAFSAVAQERSEENELEDRSVDQASADSGTRWSDTAATETPALAQRVDAESPDLARPLQLDPIPRSSLALATTFGGLLGVGAGFGLAWGPALASWRNCGPDEDFCGFGSLIVMTTFTWATPATTALGIWAGGRAVGGRGRYDLTLMGSALGGTFGAGLMGLGLAFAENTPAYVFASLAVPLFEWAGGLLAYHLSHHASSRPERLRFVPSARMERGGASLQLSGMF